MKFKFVFLMFVLFVSFGSCDKEKDLSITYVSFDKELFQMNRDKWNDLNLKNYSYEYTLSSIHYYEIVIKEGEVFSVESSVDLKIALANYMTIDELFEEIESRYLVIGDILKEGSTSYSYKEIKVEYDDEYYFPTLVNYIIETIEPVELDGIYDKSISNFVIEE